MQYVVNLFGMVTAIVQSRTLHGNEDCGTSECGRIQKVKKHENKTVKSADLEEFQ